MDYFRHTHIGLLLKHHHPFQKDWWRRPQKSISKKLVDMYVGACLWLQPGRPFTIQCGGLFSISEESGIGSENFRYPKSVNWRRFFLLLLIFFAKFCVDKWWWWFFKDSNIHAPPWIYFGKNVKKSLVQLASIISFPKSRFHGFKPNPNRHYSQLTKSPAGLMGPI